MGLEFEQDINGIHVSCDVKNRTNVFLSESGTGKTFFFNILLYVCSGMNKEIAIIDDRQETRSEAAIISMCQGANVIVFDNADLYLNENILNSVPKDAVVFISMKKVWKLGKADYGLTRINYDGDSLVVRGQ